MKKLVAWIFILAGLCISAVIWNIFLNHPDLILEKPHQLAVGFLYAVVTLVSGGWCFGLAWMQQKCDVLDREIERVSKGVRQLDAMRYERDEYRTLIHRFMNGVDHFEDGKYSEQSSES